MVRTDGGSGRVRLFTLKEGPTSTPATTQSAATINVRAGVGDVGKTTRRRHVLVWRGSTEMTTR